MTNEDDDVSLSPTVLQVIDRFVARMRADDGIENDVIQRLNKILRNPTVPKPDDIYTVLYDSSKDAKE